jgi:hypothetical protein
MEWAAIVDYIPLMVGAAVVVSLGSVWGYVHNTKMKIQAGYPLEGMWGQSLHPKRDAQTDQRVMLLTQENAALQAEIGSVKDRLANVERIVTDSGFQLTHEIDRLRIEKPEKGVN